MHIRKLPGDTTISQRKGRSKHRRRKTKTGVTSIIYVEVCLHKILSALAFLIFVAASVFYSKDRRRQPLRRTRPECHFHRSHRESPLATKAKREGKYFVQIDTFFPSSKMCSCCGFKLEKLDLAMREWTCPHCGSHHDRDVNAAANIRAEGIRKLRAQGLPVLRRETSSPNAR